jgi:hypothetical protein
LAGHGRVPERTKISEAGLDFLFVMEEEAETDFLLHFQLQVTE